MPAPYAPPEIVENEDGWGPGNNNIPPHLADVPFAPYGKGDKIGRASDWTLAAYQKYPGRYGQQQGPPVFNFFANEEEENFHLVDNRPVKTTKFGQRRFNQNRFQGGRGRGDRNDPRGQQDGRGDRNAQKKQEQQKRQPWQPYGQQQRGQASSVEIKQEWAVIDQIQFQSLQKLSCAVGEPTDVVSCGELEYYDKAFDRVGVKQETPLEKTKRAFRSVTTSDDPIIRKLASDNQATVFATDAILTTIMCMRSSRYSWDLLVSKQNGKIFFDKRANSNLHLLTVNETAPEENIDDKDHLNAMQPLAIEATMINQNFSQQVLVKGGDKFKYEQPNPFVSPDDDEELASCAYRYRKWRLNEAGEVDIIVRCEVDGVLPGKGDGDVQLLSIKALNETDMRAQDWRKKLEGQRGSVLMSEAKNNKNKVAKWTASALLAGADMIKMGYVSRVGPRDNTNHVILSTQALKPKEFAGQIMLNMDNCWGIVRALVDLLLSRDDGKFLLVKDPAKEILRVYAIPMDAFEFEGAFADEAA